MSLNKISGDDAWMDPPVPIPNTVVKHPEAESTCLVTGWEDRKLPVSGLFLVHYTSIAQSVEHLTFNQGVPRSSRGWITNYGPLVKRSRHRPFTAVTGVRFPYGSPIKYAGVAQW